MRVIQAFRFAPDPNRNARTALAKHVGTTRFVYNWGLKRARKALQAGSAHAIHDGSPPRTAEVQHGSQSPKRSIRHGDPRNHLGRWDRTGA